MDKGKLFAVNLTEKLWLIPLLNRQLFQNMRLNAFICNLHRVDKSFFVKGH